MSLPLDSALFDDNGTHPTVANAIENYTARAIPELLANLNQVAFLPAQEREKAREEVYRHALGVAMRAGGRLAAALVKIQTLSGGVGY